MAKRSLFWGQASGKLGETVLYRAGGEQRTRTYVAKIKNPKTLAQVENRLSMSNFAATYRILKPILANSFPNRPTNQSGFNAFVKANKSINSPVLTPDAALQGLCVPYKMTMSEGYVSEFGEVVPANLNYGQIIGYDVTNNRAAEEIGTAIDGGIVNDGAQIKTLVMAMGIPENATITLIVADYKDTGYKCSYKSFPVASLENDTTFGLWQLAFDEEKGGGQMVFGANYTGEQMFEGLATLIISWKDANGKLQITTSKMHDWTGYEHYGKQFVKGGEYYEDVLNFYGYNKGSVLG